MGVLDAIKGGIGEAQAKMAGGFLSSIGVSPENAMNVAIAYVCQAMLEKGPPPAFLARFAAQGWDAQQATELWRVTFQDALDAAKPGE